MRKYIAQLTIICALLSIVGCGRKWNNPVESAVPLPGEPGLISPANNVWIWNTQNTITFTWSKVSGATNYKLLLSNNSTISDSFVAIEIADTFYNWVDTNKLGKIYWQVKAWNPINEWKASNIHVFEKGPYCVGKTSLDTFSFLGCVKKITNDYIYLFNSPNITIINIADITNPFYVKQVLATNGAFVNAVQLNNNILYCYGQSLAYYNVSDPLNPQHIWSVSAGFECTGLAIKDSILFVINVLNNLRIYNISDPTVPILLDTLHLNVSDSRCLAIKDSILFIANGSNGITLVNVSNTNNPTYIKTIGTSYDVYRLTIVNNTLYCETPLQVYDISNLMQPILQYTNSSCNNWNSYITNSYIIYWDTVLKVNDILTNQSIGSYTKNTTRQDYYQNYAYCYIPWYSSNNGFEIVKIIP